MAQIQSLAQELPYATSVATGKKKYIYIYIFWALSLLTEEPSPSGDNVQESLGWLPDNYWNAVTFFKKISFLFMTTPVAYGSSGARGQIGAAAAGLHHSHSHRGSQAHLQPLAQLRSLTH